MQRELAQARWWFALSFASLLLAGVLALLLVVGRLPVLSAAFHDPQVFRRFLVAHVVLALVVWFQTFLTALYLCVPGERKGWGGGAALGAVGIALIVAGAFVPGATPILSNYIPVVDHPLFLAGLFVLAAGIATTLLGPRLFPMEHEEEEGILGAPPAFGVGMRAAALAFLAALVSFATGFATTPRELPTEVYYEVAFWGGGHALQFAGVAAMLSVWVLLLRRACGRSPVRRGAAVVLFGLLVLPAIVAPVLALAGATSSTYRVGYTRLMQYGVFPIVTIVLFLGLRAIVRARREGRLSSRGLLDPGILAFLASGAMTVVGFLLGAAIRGSNTMVTAHYHASVGAVTVAFMAVTFPLLDALGLRAPRGLLQRAVRWQPEAYAVGQTVFALGLALAGTDGMARKTYGAEQQVRSLAGEVGMWVMGFGGLLAAAAGILFLCVLVAAWIPARRRRGMSEEMAPAGRARGLEAGAVRGAVLALLVALVASGCGKTQTEPDAAELFKANCAQCHGDQGAGDGPLANTMYPKPRNFTTGKFKFASGEGLPTDDDLYRTVTYGIPGTQMVGFDALSEAERKALVQHVKRLSIAKFEVADRAEAEREYGGKGLVDVVEEGGSLFARVNHFAFRGTCTPLTIPEPPGKSAELLALGKSLFEGELGGCVKCHGATGLGDGPSAAEQKDAWGNTIRPRAFVREPFKRGVEPKDLYRTITIGVQGTPMPSHAKLDERQRWALVYYVRVLAGKETME